MSDNDIQHQSEGGQGRFVLKRENGEAYLSYRHSTKDIVIADHTFVPNALRGHGIAAKLADALVIEAQAQNWRIVPQCSYVAAQFDRHPAWAPLRA